MKWPSRKERNSPKIALDFELLDALTAAVKAVISNCAQTLNVQSDMAALDRSFMNAAGGLGCLAGGHSGVLIPRRGSLDRPVPSLGRQARWSRPAFRRSRPAFYGLGSFSPPTHCRVGRREARICAAHAHALLLHLPAQERWGQPLSCSVTMIHFMSLVAEMLGLRAPDKRWAGRFGIKKRGIGCDATAESVLMIQIEL